MENPLDPHLHMDEGINLIDLMLVLLKRKLTIFVVVAAAALLSTSICLIIPDKYKATARILPPQEPSALKGFLPTATGLLGVLPDSLTGTNSIADVYIGILESDTVAGMLIESFDLLKYYDLEFREDAVAMLESRTQLEIDPESQIISISVEDRDPRRAADMANTYIDALDSINRKMNITSGYRKRLFLEKRLKEVKSDLSRAETDLKAFQEKYKLIAIEEQARFTVEGAARIKAEIITAQTELHVLKQFSTEKDNQVILLRSKINELEHQLLKIENGDAGGSVLKPETAVRKNANFYVPFDEMPALRMYLLRLMREAQIQEEVFKLLTSQYELAKMEEAKDVNTIQVLDPAVPPEIKSSPRRILIVGCAIVAAIFMGVFLAFFMEFIDHLKSDAPDRYEQIVRHLGFKVQGSGFRVQGSGSEPPSA